VPSDDVVLQRITGEIEKIGQQNHLQSSALCSLDLLFASTRCIGHTQMPAVVARYASRQIISHSLSLEQIQRISGCEWLFGLPFKSRQTISSEQRDPGKPANSDTVPDWATAVSDAILVGDIADAHNRIRAISERRDLPALALRIADYAARAVRLRPIVNGEKSAKRFAERLHLLSCRLHVAWSDADPVQLSDSKIENGYKTMLEGIGNSPSADRIRRELIVSAKGFHSYLRNCHGKGPLTNADLLAPRKLLDRVDVDLITIDEYREILHQIALRWPGSARADRRNIATMLVALGFRSGLRREEARLLRTDDVCLWGGRDELLIRPSEDHTLKSDSARRRMPVGITMPTDELQLLSAWHRQRVEELSGVGDGYLFGSKS
jgi:integrase